jgi:hypothetical protein
MQRIKWTQDNEVKLKKLIAEGAGLKEIADKFGASLRSVRHKATRLGLKVHRSNGVPKAFQQDDLSFIKWVYAERIQHRTVNGINGCVDWGGACSKEGYGQIRVSQKTGMRRLYLVHRVALQATLGRILETTELALHTCDNPSCCNPAHLYVGSAKQNAMDMADRCRVKGPIAKGHNNNFNSPITEAEAKRIKCLYRETALGYKRIAEIIGVSKFVVRNVVTGKTWKHVA